MKLVWQILNQGKNWTTIYSWVFLSEIEKTGVKQVCRILNLEKKLSQHHAHKFILKLADKFVTHWLIFKGC